MKIVTIVGARPQFIKAAIVSHRLREHSGIAEVLVHTGQHYDADMSDIFFDELEIAPPEHALGIGGGSHASQTARMLEGLESVLLEEDPGLVLVYGDTNSTLAGALTAAKLNIPIAHVEAGMRSFNRAMPEEINRVLTDHLSAHLFTPTVTADTNLAREGIDPRHIHLVGDVMYDASLYYGARAERDSDILARLSREPGTFILATIHRAENTDSRERLTAIADALSVLAHDRPVVMPIHPRTTARLAEFGLEDRLSDVQRIPPAGYLDMQALERHAVAIVTDSGGVQKEAFFHRVPCITVRTETEWVELVECGWNRLVPPGDTDAIVSGVENAMREKPTDAPDDIYGGGTAAQRTAEHLADIANSGA
ncbi:MAG: UDP-N-acetylglucosamine 2-epimerase (non-hydrolyzing) [Alphaproteobacteria bacterium]